MEEWKVEEINNKKNDGRAELGFATRELELDRCPEYGVRSSATPPPLARSVYGRR